MSRRFWWSIPLGFFVAGGIAALDGFGPDSPGRVLVMIGATWVIVLLGLELLWRVRARRRTHAQDLFSHGTTAPATVVRVSTTGTGDGYGSLRVVLELRVEPQGAQPFTAEKTLWVQHNAVPRAGDVLQVAYDPADPRDLVVGDVGTGFSGSQVLDIHRQSGFTDEIPEVPDGWQLGVGRGVLVFAVIGLVALWLPYSPGTTREAAIIVPFSVFGAAFLAVPVVLLAKGRLRMLRARYDTGLFRTGIRAEGVFTAVDIDSRTVVNEVNVPVRFTLRISAPSVTPFDRSFSMLVPSRSLPIPGDRIGVALDRDDPSVLALDIDWSTNTRGGFSLRTRHGVPEDRP